MGPSSGPLTSLRRLLDGPPPAFPPALDRVSRRWATAPPRARMAATLAAVVAIVALAGYGAARSPWGAAVPVLVAAHDLPAGRTLQTSDLRPATWPARLVPPGAPRHADDAAGRVLAVGAPTGSLVTAAHLAAGGLAATLPPGRVAVPVALPGVAVTAGQRVDVLAATPDGGGARLASGARVLSVDGDTVWVDVERDEAAAVAGAAAFGQLTVAVLAVGG